MPNYLIIGLGNPGEEYARTRHNVGFMTVDLLADRLGGTYWKHEAGALTCAVKYRADDTTFELVLAKPQTFMNLSGAAAGKLLELYDLDPAHLIVIADELDIPAGEVRSKVGGGHAGHNGHRSIIERLGTRDYTRVRVGIGRPPGRMDPADYVLAPLRPQTLEDLQAAAEQAADITLDLISVN
jgi:PTH1 family peptidyl-tRNA hydrolase